MSWYGIWYGDGQDHHYPPNPQVQAIRELIAAKKSASVSGFVQHAVNIALSDAAGWRTMLDEALLETGGPLTREEVEWADALLDPNKLNRQDKKRSIDRMTLTTVLTNNGS